MSRRLLIGFLIAVVAFTGCHRTKVIPRGTMAKIYAEMFVADQEIMNAPRMRNVADTSWVYDPIFQKYGYNSDDWRSSMAYYINDATRYARILKRSSSIIEQEIKACKKEKALLAKLQSDKSYADSLLPERIYYLTALGNPKIFGNDSLSFFVDSAGGAIYFDPREWADTAYFGPEMVLMEDKILAEQEAIAAAEAEAQAEAEAAAQAAEEEALAEEAEAERKVEQAAKRKAQEEAVKAKRGKSQIVPEQPQEADEAPKSKNSKTNEKDSSKVRVRPNGPKPDSLRVRSN